MTIERGQAETPGDDDAEEFLRVEQAVTELMAQLEALRAETENYRTARGAIDETAHGVSAVAENLNKLTSRVADVIETLRTIGTPQLLEGEQRLAVSVGEMGQHVAHLETSVAGLVSTVGGQLQIVAGSSDSLRLEVAAAGRAQAKRLEALDSAIERMPRAQALSDLRERVESVMGKQADALDESVKSIDRLQESLAATTRAIGRLKNLMTWYLVATLIAIGALAALAAAVRA